MHPSPTIVTLTLNPTLDLSSSVATVTPDDKLRCSLPAAEPGGGGINVSRVCNRFGESTLTIVPVGGSVGSRIHDLLQAEGLTALPIEVPNETRQAIAITENCDWGANIASYFPGYR